MRISRLRCVLLGISLLSCLSWTSLPARAQRQDPADPAPQRREAVRCASSDDATPNGLAVVLPPGEKGYKSGNLEALNNPFVSGVAVQINWRDIEPVQGKPDWSKLDALFAAAISSQKWVQLDIFPGFFLLNGPWQEQRPICSSYHMALTMAPSRSFPCHGIPCTSTVGSHS